MGARIASIGLMECLRSPSGMSARRHYLRCATGLGCEALYYVEGMDGVAFASEVKALLTSSDVPRELNRKYCRNTGRSSECRTRTHAVSWYQKTSA